MVNIKFNRILDIFINDLIPQTRIVVKKGNKIFGAFIIKKSDLSLVITGTNNEISNPLYHGEISALFNFFETKNLNPKDYYFISSHEPCSLCLSAITWSGFDNFYYFFPYADTKSRFNIPHDLNILKEVFYINEGGYKKDNKYWKSFSIIDEIKEFEDPNNPIFIEKIDKIKLLYEELSTEYQNTKVSNNIPLK
ncbi:nucleoside deaminase [Pelagibacterales bacterium SAG-MED31]|nr:nucleoside deaminase [Pelagibacterales bacterium SAG-MED31]